MGTRHLFCIMAMLVAGVIGRAHTKVTYRTSSVAKAAAVLQLHGLDSLPQGSNIVMCKGMRLVVRKDAGQQVEHIGLPLFPATMEGRDALPVYDFLEHAFLKHKMRLIDNPVRGEGVVFKTGNWNSLDRVTDSSDVSVQCYDNERYVVEWTRQGRTIVAVEVPINYDRVLGAERRELEEIYLRELCAGAAIPLQRDTVPVQGLLQPAETDGVCVLHRGWHLQHDINRDLYYSWTADSSWTLVCDTLHPVMALTNAFLASEYIDAGAGISIKFNLYGGRKQTVQVPLRQFMAFVARQNETAYIGIEREGEHMVEMSLFLDNPGSGYEHVMFITCDPTQLYNEGFTLQAEAYLYSPTNIN